MAGSRIEKHVLESRWGMGVCAICGATVVLGEPAVRVQIDGRAGLLCGACAAAPESALAARSGGQSARLAA